MDLTYFQTYLGIAGLILLLIAGIRNWSHLYGKLLTLGGILYLAARMAALIEILGLQGYRDARTGVLTVGSLIIVLALREYQKLKVSAPNQPSGKILNFPLILGAPREALAE